MRGLFLLLLAVFGLMAARRWTQKIGQGSRPSSRPSRKPPLRVAMRDHSVDQVICATCKTEYAPDQTAWQCPTCKR